MKKITYKKLSIQDFLSIGHDAVVIDFQNGLNLITGTNIDNPERKNGTGKSAIIEGFFYALFGTTIRDIKKEFVINNVTKGKGKIELTFDVQTEQGISSYKIVRQLKPSTVELWKCGVKDEDISKDSIINTNKYICDLIGSNPSICKSCDILSLSDNVPFMAKKPEEKRKFIEDIFCLEIFGKMLKELKELIKENKSEISITSAKIEEITNSIFTLETQYENQRKLVEERQAILERKKNELVEKIENTEREINSIPEIDVAGLEEENEKLFNGLERIDFKIGQLLTGISELNASKKIKVSDLDKSTKVGGVKCDKCLQDIDWTHKEYLKTFSEQLRTEIGELDTDIQKFENERKDWIEKKGKIQDKAAKNHSKITEFKNNALKKTNLERILDQYTDSLKELDNDSTCSSGGLESFAEAIEKSKERKENENQKFESLKQKSDDYEMCKFILGEEGIKSFIIKRLLEMLNSSVQKYITSLGMTMRCKFDEYFDEKITNAKGKDISYWNFSGGERRTVDLACAWAFKDIKRKIAGVSSNVELYDEIMDGAFDERGLDLLIEVLKERIEKNKISCYTISHRKETLKHIDAEIVNLEKENDITRRINF